MIPVVIPAKPLQLALSRLAGVLSDSERLAVQMAMLSDVIRAGVGFSDRVLVVSADPLVEAIATDLGAQLVADAVPAAGIDVAVARGIAAAAAGEVMILMGDLPLATSADLHALWVTLGRGPGIACAVSFDGTGTNALVLRPPTVVDTAFGVDSLRRHLDRAERRGVPAVASIVAGLERDIDTPEDLAALLRSAHECQTVRVCHTLGIAEQLVGAAAGQ